MPKDRLVIKSARKSDHAAYGRGVCLKGGETWGINWDVRGDWGRCKRLPPSARRFVSARRVLSEV